MTADITLRGPGDVVAILPYQLGYHPRDSAVVISLRGKRVGLVARTDLPPEKFVDEVVSSLMGPLVRDGATSVIVVGYEDEPDTSQPLLVALVEQLERAGIHVVDVAVVRDGRRYSPICSEPCCPPEGVALPDPADVPGVAEYVALGRSPLRSRGAVEELVAPEPWRCLGVARAVDSRSRMPRGRRRSVAAWKGLLDPGEAGRRPPDRRAVADLALGLADIPWRDGLIAWLVPSVLPTEEIDPRVMALLCAAMPTWGGMGPPPAPERRASRVLTGRGLRPGGRARRSAPPRAGPVPVRARPVPRRGGGRVHRGRTRGLGRWRRRDRAGGRRPGRSPGSRLPTGQAARAPRRHGAAAAAGHRAGASRGHPGAGRLTPSARHSERLTWRVAARVAWMPVMSPSAKPRFAGRQPSSRWGAPGDDLAARTVWQARARGASCHDGHPDEVDRSGLASR